MNNEKARVSINMPIRILDELDKIKDEMGLNRSALINMICKQYVDSQLMIKTVSTVGNADNLEAVISEVVKAMAAKDK